MFEHDIVAPLAAIVSSLLFCIRVENNLIHLLHNDLLSMGRQTQSHLVLTVNCGGYIPNVRIFLKINSSVQMVAVVGTFVHRDPCQLICIFL